MSNGGRGVVLAVDRGEVGDYLASIGSIPTMGRTEVDELSRVIRDALRPPDERLAARNKLAEGNLRLVVKAAKRYLGLGLPLADLISHGNIGLLRAAHKYDPDRGTKFSTYATFWIKAAVRQAVSRQSRPVRLPDYMHWLVRRYDDARRAIQDETGAAPSHEEVRLRIDMPPTKVRHLDEALAAVAACRPPRESDEARARGSSPDDDAARREAAAMLGRLLRRLPARHARVLRRRVGDDAPLHEIGREMGLTRERVRQLVMEALAMAQAAARGRPMAPAARAVRGERKTFPAAAGPAALTPPAGAPS
jgi:RNA polymerase primary sigma factor